MRSNPLRNIIFIAWLVLCISNAIDLIKQYYTYGITVFSDYSFIFNCALVLITLLIIVFLFIQNYKVFLILFAVYVAVEAAYALTDTITITQIYSLQGMIENYSDKPQNIVYFILRYYLITLVMTLYAAGFITSLILRLKMHYKTNFFVNRTIDVGYGVAVVNICVMIFWFMCLSTGFDFLTVLLNLFTTAFFSLVYISVPRFMYR